MFDTLDHVVIAVRDLRAASETYTRLLGLRPSWRGSQPALGTANALFRLENIYLELLSPTGDGVIARRLTQRLEEDGEGLFALAFGTGDAGVCATKLRECGVAAGDPVDGEGREAATGNERRWRNVYVPETDTRGVLLFAIEHRSPSDSLPPAQPLAKASASGLDHVVVFSSDAEASCALYRDRLGLRLALDRRFEQRGMRLLFFRIGGITIELATRLNVPSDPDARDRLWGLSYRVSDLIAAQARLAAAGFDGSDVRVGQRSGTLVCTVRGETHGVATLFIGPDKREQTAAA